MSTTEALPPQAHLARVLGLGFGVAVIFGGTMGVGILRLPGEIAARLGNPLLVLTVWVVGGVYALLGAISLSELAAAMPEAGGFYVYAKRAFGPGAGFAQGWADWVSNCAAIAYATVAATEYLVQLMPVLAASAAAVQTAIALGLLGVYCGLHWFGLRLGSGIQKLTSSVTAITFVSLAVACLLHAKAAPVAAAGMRGASGIFGLIAPVIAVLPAIVVAYDGWYEAIYFAEEDTNAAKNLPRAMIGGVLLIVGLYLGLNVAFLRVLTIPELAQSKLAAADAARIVFPAWSGTFVTVLSLLTLLSLTNALLLGAPRILFAVGRDADGLNGDGLDRAGLKKSGRGGFLRGVGRMGPNGTPRTALVMTAGMVALFVLSGKFNDIVNVAAIVVAATYCLNYVAVIVLRWREPGMARPFRAWGFPVTTVLVLVGSVVFLVGDVVHDPVSTVRAGVLLGIAAPVYWWGVRVPRAGKG